jgi:hypothetical protein
MDLQPVACCSGMCETGPPHQHFPAFSDSKPGLQRTPDFA